jgi:hypothetical protein
LTVMQEERDEESKLTSFVKSEFAFLSGQ